MYTKQEYVINDNADLSNYVDGYDVFNSKLLYKMREPGILKSYYEIKVYQYRPDLIAKDFYGSEDYLGILLVQTGASLDNYEVGKVLELIPKNTIDNIISNI